MIGKTSLGWSNKLQRFLAAGMKQEPRIGSPSKSLPD
jgi:hypothetical protein